MEEEDLKKWILDLAKFMVGQGYVSLPLPRIRFDSTVQDGKNDPRTFKTGNFSESENVITLFTNGRAVKDILRTFAHELIHVRQRQDGRLQNIGTENAIADDEELRSLEGEAFLKGSLALRDWTEKVTHQTA